MPALTGALARAGDAKSLKGSEVDPAVAATLERAAPIYRKAWWKKHREANRNWQKSIETPYRSPRRNRACFHYERVPVAVAGGGVSGTRLGLHELGGRLFNQGQSACMSEPVSESSGELWIRNYLSRSNASVGRAGFRSHASASDKTEQVLSQGLASLIFFTAGEAVRRVIIFFFFFFFFFFFNTAIGSGSRTLCRKVWRVATRHGVFQSPA